MTYTSNKQYFNGLSYDDVFIIPQYSDISSRKEVNVNTSILDANNKLITIPVPIMNANMDTVAGEEISSVIANAGGLATLHRFQSIESACTEFVNVLKKLNDPNTPVFVSLGVNRDSFERAQALYDVGARYFIIDIAHGHSKQMKDMIGWMKTNLNKPYIMAGNVGTEEAVADLVAWGANAVKIFIGPGAVCLTKNITGVTLPTFSCIKECYQGKLHAEQKIGRPVPIVADGGCKEIGDICKAIGAKADFVMTGKLFAGCIEAPGKGIYRGSASIDVQTLYRTDKDYVPTPEGMSTNVDLTNESAAHIVEHIAGGLRSACSYVGARNLIEFKKKVTFGIRHNKT